MRLINTTAGQIFLNGDDITDLGADGLRQHRRRFQIVFQDPYASLNPRRRAGFIVREPLDLMGIGRPLARDGMVADLFERVGLLPEQRQLFPHQFSGGQRQRIAIARALATEPELLVLDEPVSALDVAIQAQILNLLKSLQRDLGLTFLFISHDLGVIQHMCDRIGVMYLGQIVEEADRDQLFADPRHPYTEALLQSIPSIARRGRHPAPIQGDPPNPISPPPGCRFHPRCLKAQPICRHSQPELKTTPNHRRTACHLVNFEHDFLAPTT